MMIQVGKGGGGNDWMKYIGFARIGVLGLRGNRVDGC